MAGCSGGFNSICGVCPLVPAQHPQVHSDEPEQLIGFLLSRRTWLIESWSSSATLQVEGQLPVIGITGIVLEARNLQGPEGYFAGVQILRGVIALRLEGCRGHAGNSGDSQHRGVDRAEIDRLPEGEVIGEEEPGLAVGENLIAEYLQQRLLHVGREVAGIDADG